MRLPKALSACSARRRATESTLRAAEAELGSILPEDYKALLLESDGLEGFISEAAYISLWPASDLATLNDEYAASEFIPGVTLLGTDGGGTGYGFRKEGDQVEYVSVPLVGMEPGAIVVIGQRFTEMLERLARSDHA